MEGQFDGTWHLLEIQAPNGVGRKRGVPRQNHTKGAAVFGALDRFWDLGRVWGVGQKRAVPDAKLLHKGEVWNGRSGARLGDRPEKGCP